MSSQKQGYFSWILWIGVFLVLSSGRIMAAPSAESANGKYSGLIQKLYCPADSAQYGNFRDYGYWGGGAWCGQTGAAGYWVWVNPNWYVWRHEGRQATDELPALASANGTYGDWLQTLYCPGDSAQYGQFKDYGYWGGGAWCGQTGVAGYWVWVNPNWYVWQTKY